MLSNLPVWIQSVVSIIQALSGIVMMIFTILYVVFTKRLVEQNYNTFLVVTGSTSDKKGLHTITVQNHGSSLALNIVAAVETRQLSLDDTAADFLFSPQNDD